MPKREAEQFNHKLYRKLAKAIHEAFCEDEDWCNYGQPDTEEHRHCQIAVDAENLAARVQFGKGAKVRR